MADHETPGATAPDEGQRAPDGGGVPGGSAHAIQPATSPPAKPAKAHEGPRKTFEDWATARYGVAFDQRGRATGIVTGKPVTRNGKAVKDATRSAALINGARTKHRIPVGRLMTEDDFNKLVDATAAIEVR
ncbi:hypothetical protein [Sorangium sp. So ce1024]|uniref:hypothetical protein n=1 Tax=Sorangium sp. So ce1024 TaxID=3133327 RepID=UPI003F030B86